MTSVTELIKTEQPKGEPKGFVAWIRPNTSAELVQRVMLVVLVVGVVALLIASPVFRTPQNLLNIIQQASLVGIVAGGMQFMVISGGFDLSVGATAAAAGCAAAFVSIERGLLLGIAVGLLVGLIAGIGNGVLIAKVRINPFIATFGMQAVITGLLFVATDAKPIAPLPAEWRQLGLFNISGLSFVSIVFIVVMVLLFGLLKFTRYGKHVYAVGSNSEGSRRAGVRVSRVLITTYAIGGVTAAIAGILLVSLSGVGSPSAGSTWSLLAIAAVILGGTPLGGGVGGLSSAVLGVLLLTVLTNVLTLYSISAHWQPFVMGLGVLAAVSTESIGRMRKK